MVIIHSVANTQNSARKFVWNKSYNNFVNKSDFNFEYKNHLDSKENGKYFV